MLFDMTTTKKNNWIKSGRDYVRELVRIRDGRTCQRCGKGWCRSKRRLDVHHLNGLCGKKSRAYDRLADMPGLITLCHKCHLKHHSKTSTAKHGLREKESELRAQREQGMSYDKIGKQHGVSSQAIYFILHGHKEKPRCLDGAK